MNNSTDCKFDQLGNLASIASLPCSLCACVWLIRTLLIIVNHVLEYYLSYIYEVLIVDYFGTHSYLSYNKISGAVPIGLANIPKGILFQKVLHFI